MALYNRAVLTDSPVGYWRLGEGASLSQAVDSSGNMYHGTYSDPPRPILRALGATADGDTAVTFTGTNYITMGDLDALELGGAGGSGSVEFFLKKSSAPASEQIILGKGSYLASVTSTGTIRFAGYAGSTAIWDDETVVTVCNGAWRHIVCTWNGATGDVMFYVDGALSRTKNFATGSTTPTTKALSVGGLPGLIGSVDEVAIYTSVLNATRVAAHYAARTSVPVRKYALSGVERCGASLSGSHSARLFVSIAGTHYATGRSDASKFIKSGSLTITDVLDQTPNTCQFTVKGFLPTDGQEVIITLGSKNNLTRLFAGYINNASQGYIGTPINGEHQISAIDYTPLLNRRKVVKRYTNQTATAIAQDLIATYVSGFTSVNVQAGLDTLDEISFTNQDMTDALTQLAKRIGGYWFVDYRKDLHFFTSDASVTNPTMLTTTHPTANDIRAVPDIGQIVTRAFVEGGGVSALADCAVGETMIPVVSSTWYNTAGGTVASGPQRITYTGITDGGEGTIVGPGVTPSAKPGTTLVEGGGSLTAGAHVWAYTWVTGAGESLPSPLSTSVTAMSYTPPTPGAAPSAYPTPYAVGGTTYNFSGSTAGLTIGASYTYVVVFITVGGTGISAASAESNAVVSVASLNNPAVPSQITVTFDVPGDGHPSGGVLIRQALIYRIENGSGVTELAGFTADLGTHPVYLTFVSFTDVGGGSGAAFGGSAAASYFTVSLAGIAIGPVGTTSRKVYQTASGGSQLKLMSTIANNTATTATATAADASLGANVPTSDTSGLTQPSGQVLQGSSTLPVTGTSAFSTSGGWALVASQALRYTGISGNTLTGIPASGVGAIAATIAYGATATAAPALTGVPASGAGAILYTILKGDQVNLLAQVDDYVAQAALAAYLSSVLGSDSDGIQEDYLSDGRISYTEALARGRAQLALRGLIETAVTYKSRDKNTASGRVMSVNVVAPTSVFDDFKIQQVTITGFSENDALFPTFSVSSAPTRFSFDDLLTLARKAA